MAKRPAPRWLGQKLLRIRTGLGLSQAGIVEALKYEESPLRPSQISNFEQGKREPPVMLLLAYARLAKVSVETLIDDKKKLPLIQRKR
jgi:transcriptional regulator with XRE-family HTH domain